MHSDISVDYDAHHKTHICVEYTLQLDALDSIVSTKWRREGRKCLRKVEH